jgi:DNA-directed RNA polymerase subunit alpha
MIELETTPSHPRIEEVEARATCPLRGQPAADGYGVTLGNALRRVLLNSLEGRPSPRSRSPASSTSSARSTNVKEDVTQIVLNVKKLRLRSFAGTRHPQAVKHGAGPVTAGDIAESADVEIVNPELVLLTLDSTPGRSRWT